MCVLFSHVKVILMLSLTCV